MLAVLDAPVITRLLSGFKEPTDLLKVTVPVPIATVSADGALFVC